MVMFQQVNLLSGNPTGGGGDGMSGGGASGSGRCGSRIQECWSFEHPRRDMVLDTRGEYILVSRRACL